MQKPLLELLKPRSDRMLKIEAVRGILLKGSYSPITRVVRAEVRGKITPRVKALQAKGEAVDFPSVSMQSVEGEHVVLPTGTPGFVGLCFRHFGYVRLTRVSWG